MFCGNSCEVKSEVTKLIENHNFDIRRATKTISTLTQIL